MSASVDQGTDVVDFLPSYTSGRWVRLWAGGSNIAYLSLVPTDGNGRFEIYNVPNGTYVLASATSKNGPWTTEDGAYSIASNPPSVKNLGVYNVVTDYGADRTGATNAATAFQNAINDASAAGGGTVWVPPGTYLFTAAVNMANKVSFQGVPRSVLIKRTASGDCFNALTGLDKVTMLGIDFDMTNQGQSCIRVFGSDAGAQVTDLLVRDCRFSNPSNTWLLQLNYTIVDPTVPVSKNRNLRFEDCVIDGAGQTGTLGPFIIVNCQDTLISGCRFVNTPATTEGLLAVYGYNRDLHLFGCHFEGWSSRAMYIQQSDSVLISACEFRVTTDLDGIVIFDAKDVRLDNNFITTGSGGNGIKIVDFVGTTFDSHTGLYSQSSGVKVQGNRMAGMNTCVVLNLSNQQGQTDIFVDGNMVSPLRSLFLVTNMPASPSGTVKRLFIRDNHVVSHSGFSGGAALIEIPGNAGAPNGGLQTIVITGNLCPASGAGGSGQDIEITGLADDVWIAENRLMSPNATSLVAAACTNVRIKDNPGLELQSPAFAASYTPDWTKGQTIRLGAATGNLTVNLPTPHAAIGQELEFMLLQDGTGGRTVAWNAGFIQSWSDTGNTLNKRSSIRFRCVATDTYEQVGAQRAWA